VDVEGKLDGGAGADQFHGLIKRLLSEGDKRIVINLEKTPWANSRGIGLLIGAFTSVTNAGGRLVLAQVPARISETLRVTRLILIFEMFSTIEAAVLSVTAPGDDGATARVAHTRAISTP
jgi:anti-sigma B factor antagonist